jgi:hypothetical protein
MEMATPWNVPLLGRRFGTAALVGVTGAWLLAFQWGHAAAPRTASVADEHGLVVAMLKKQLGGEKQEPLRDVVTEAPAIAARRLSAWSRTSGNGSSEKIMPNETRRA